MNTTLKTYFLLFFFFVMLGMVMVFNIDAFNTASPDMKFWKLVRPLAFNFIIAMGGFLAAYLIPLTKMRNYLKFFLILLFLLILSTFLIGTEVNGSKRWINLYFMMLQPSEFAKVILIYYLAEVICNKREKIALWKDLIYPFGMISLFVLLIAIEDLGTGLIIFSVAVLLFMMGGMRIKYLLVLGILAVTVLTILIAMKPYRLERIKVWMDPWKYRQSAGYQQVQSEVALGRGGIDGVGFGNSQRKMRYLPEARTDFIFAILGEEFGFIGTTLFTVLAMLFFSLGIYFALSCSSMFHMYLIAGFVLLLGIQTLINLGVVSAAFPNKGVPLPFISYGGSSLLASSLMVGFIMNAVTDDSKNVMTERGV